MSTADKGHRAKGANPTSNLCTGLNRIREAAKKDKNVRFTALLHHITVDQLRESYKALNPKAAAGVDGMTWKQYGEGLEERLEGLRERIHRGAYRAKPAKRSYIPKDGTEMRPLGIAAFEDKIVQHATVRILEQIYEEDFLGFSYGFRPKRSPHKALDALYMGIKIRKVNWILDVDNECWAALKDCVYGVMFHGNIRIISPRCLFRTSSATVSSSWNCMS